MDDAEEAAEGDATKLAEASPHEVHRQVAWHARAIQRRINRSNIAYIALSRFLSPFSLLPSPFSLSLTFDKTPNKEPSEQYSITMHVLKREHLLSPSPDSGGQQPPNTCTIFGCLRDISSAISLWNLCRANLPACIADIRFTAQGVPFHSAKRTVAMLPSPTTIFSLVDASWRNFTSLKSISKLKSCMYMEWTFSLSLSEL